MRVFNSVLYTFLRSAAFPHTFSLNEAIPGRSNYPGVALILLQSGTLSDRAERDRPDL